MEMCAFCDKSDFVIMENEKKKLHMGSSINAEMSV